MTAGEAAAEAVGETTAQATGETPGIDGLLGRAREQIDRVTPAQALAEAGEGALIVDTRPVEQRARHGEVDLPGVLVVDCNVLEWRLDPTSGAALPQADAGARVLVLCQQGYSSSLAAQALREIGVHRAGDVVGGFEAWLADGLPVRAWDSSQETVTGET